MLNANICGIKLTVHKVHLKVSTYSKFSSRKNVLLLPIKEFLEKIVLSKIVFSLKKILQRKIIFIIKQILLNIIKNSYLII